MSVHRHLHLLNALKERAITLLHKVIEVNGVLSTASTRKRIART
jgi:hypothetical protein